MPTTANTQGLGQARLLHCSFCGKHEGEVQQLVAGPNVYICGVCVDIAHKIVEEDRLRARTSN